MLSGGDGKWMHKQALAFRDNRCTPRTPFVIRMQRRAARKQPDYLVLRLRLSGCRGHVLRQYIDALLVSRAVLPSF